MMTPEEHKQGWFVCDCGKFAFVFKASVLERMKEQHPDYHGECCPECNMWMVAVDKLPKEQR
jgi:hypothetical protein